MCMVCFVWDEMVETLHTCPNGHNAQPLCALIQRSAFYPTQLEGMNLKTEMRFPCSYSYIVTYRGGEMMMKFILSITMQIT